MLDSLLMIGGVFLIAFLFAPVGMGGGMLFAPLLHYGAGWDIDAKLLAVSLGLTWAVSIGSGLRHRREGLYNNAATKIALSGALIGALVGVVVVNIMADGLDTAFKLLSIAMLVWALVKTKRKLEERQPENASVGEEQRTVDMQALPLRLGAGVGGVLSSVLGIGAGVIYVPVLQQSAGLDARTSIGSSLNIMMVVVPVAIATLLVSSDAGISSLLTGQPAWLYLLPFVAFGGATFGAAFALKNISTTNIMKTFMTLVAVILLRYILDVVRFIG